MIESHEWANNRSYVRRTPLGERWYYVYPEGSEPSQQPQYTTSSYEQPTRKPSPTRSYSSANNYGNQSDWRQQLITLQDQCSELTRERDALQERLDEMAEAAGRAARHRRSSDSGIAERNAPCQICGQLRQENDNLQGRLSSATQELQDAKAEIARLKKQLSARNAVDVQALTRERNDLVNQVDDLHREIDSLTSELERRGSEFSDRDRKKIEIEFEKELQAADQEINQLHDEKGKLLVERDQLEEALQQAQNDFDELSAQFNLLSMKEPVHSQPAVSTLEPQRFNETSAHVRSSSPHNINNQVQSSSNNITSPAERPSKRGAGNYAPREANSLPWATLASRNQGGGHGVTKGHAAELCRVVGMSTQILENVLDPEDGVVLVQEVGPGSLAERAGIRVQDLIEKWNRKVVLSRSDWNEALETTHLGTVVRVGLLRQGIRKQVILTLPPSNQSPNL